MSLLKFSQLRSLIPAAAAAHTASSATPSNGFTSGSVAFPKVTVSSLATYNPRCSYGRLQLIGTLGAGASVTVTVTHDITSASYAVFVTPEEHTVRAIVSAVVARSFKVTVKNVSGSSLGTYPIVSYMLFDGVSNPASLVLAPAVNMSTGFTEAQTLSLTVYSSASATSLSTCDIANLAFVTDPSGYPVSYTVVSDSRTTANLAAVNSTSNSLTYSYAKAASTQTLVVQGQNAYTVDTTKKVTYSITEVYLSATSLSIGGASVTSQSFTVYSPGTTKRSQVLTTTLPRTVQSLPMTYTISANGGYTDAAVAVSDTDVTLTFTKLGGTAGSTSTTKTITVTSALSTPANYAVSTTVMAQVGYASVSASIAITEVFLSALLGTVTSYDTTQSSSGSGQSGSYTSLPTADQGYALTWSLRSTTSTPSGLGSIAYNTTTNTVSWTSVGTTGTRSIALTASFTDAMISGVTGLGSKDIDLNVAETLLSALVTNLAVCYSVRRMVDAYAGAVIKVRHSTSGDLQDFYSDATQSYLTTQTGGGGTSYATWIGANTGYVDTWYDQSGNGNNVTNTATGSTTQPKLALVSSKYVVQFETSRGTVLAFTSTIKPSTIFTTIQRIATDSYYNTIMSTPYDYGMRLSGGRLTGDSNAGDWYFSGSGTKLAYVNGASGTTLSTFSATTPLWDTLSVSIETPAWSTSQTSDTSTAFSRLGRDGYASSRSLNGYMIDMLCHTAVKDAEVMMAYNAKRLL